MHKENGNIRYANKMRVSIDRTEINVTREKRVERN